LDAVPSSIRVKIRHEGWADYSAITRVHDAAFEEPNEGRLVWALRETRRFDPDLSFVAEVEAGAVVGHILFYPVIIKADGLRQKTLELGPLAVLPEYQGNGVGSELVKEGLRTAQRHGHGSIVVLGSPAFYARFGFKPAGVWRIRPPFKVPGGAFMAIELRADELAHAEGTVQYPREFDGL
jgi:putative acetyltransferase